MIFKTSIAPSSYILYYYFSQTITAIERFLPDAGHTVGNGNRGQTTTGRVFANYFISTICQLNGRKMTAQIPRIGKKTNI